MSRIHRSTEDPTMLKNLRLAILPQPDDTTCGPTCLHSVYNYFGFEVALDDVITEVERLKDGGTLAVLLGLHALRSGFSATLYTYNLDIFDPTWFRKGVNLKKKLEARLAHRKSKKFRRACKAYIEFVSNGGKIKFRDLTPELISGFLAKQRPILTGLSATYLYQHAREAGAACYEDDVNGDPAGHFVVLSGFNARRATVRVSDPYLQNPLGDGNLHYEVNVHRVVTAILLGVLTYDGNLLIVEP